MIHLKKTIACIAFCLCIADPSASQEKSSVLLNKDILVIQAEGIAFLGSGINEDDAKTLAINDAKRNALEQAGTYLESHTAVLNNQLAKDEIITFSGGLLKIRVLKEDRQLINSMFAFRVGVEATIDTKLLDQRIADIRKDKGLREQLEAERARNKQLEARISELQAMGSSATSQEVKSVINELSASDWAIKGYYAQDYRLQIECYTKAIELDPRYIIAYYNRGIAQYSLGNHDAAVQDYSAAIALDPRNPDFYTGRGHAYSALGDYQSAIQDYNAAILLNPQQANAYNGRGLAYFSLKDCNSAIQDYNTAVGLNYQFTEAYYNRGNALYALGNYQAAIQDYNMALTLNPQYGLVYNNRGNAYYALGNVATSIQDYNTAILLNPKYPDTYYNRGNAYYSLGNYGSAVLDYSMAIELNPQYASAYYWRGGTHTYLRNPKAAADDYNNYLRINGNRNGDAENIRQWIRNLGYTPEY